MQPHLSSRFQVFNFDELEEKAAQTISPYTYAYIQNKIAFYANAAIETTYDTSAKSEISMFSQVVTQERFKAQIEVLEELLREFNVPTELNQPNPIQE